jgi:hypothetical protein
MVQATLLPVRWCRSGNFRTTLIPSLSSQMTWGAYAHSELPSPFGYAFLGKGPHCSGSVDGGAPDNAGITKGTLERSLRVEAYQPSHKFCLCLHYHEIWTTDGNSQTGWHWLEQCFDVQLFDGSSQCLVEWRSLMILWMASTAQHGERLAPSLDQESVWGVLGHAGT